MVKKTPYSKLYKVDFSEPYKFGAVSFLSLYCFCALCLFLNLACQNNRVNSTPSDNKGSSPLVGERIKGFSKEVSNNSQCESLANRLDELESLILRQKQAARQATRQAQESCQGDSAVDCGYWTGRANKLTRQVRELQEEEQKLERQRSENECQK